ncbi:MAG: phosphoglycolate phosphatase [Fusobacteria bacterium]|nr:MAG: phosphoglycolate phosphatase [Fusobacteriota bacterium]KAF0228847.1 MAG: phosphoglycolate [Fusobacteriota bacterium]
MEIKGILFDKDGTLLEFDRTWRPIANQVVDEVAKHYNFDDKVALAASIGLYEQSINPNGSLSSGTNKDVALDMLAVLKANSIDCKDEDHIKWSTQVFNKVAASLPFYPIDGVVETIKTLKEEGYYIGLSTADSVENAKLFLEKTGLANYFDYIGADDGIIMPKPAPDYMNNFCKQYTLKPSEVAVVGDTMADMNFGINSGAGLIVGVLSGTGTTSLLRDSANIVINSVKDLIIGKKTIWEDM